MAPMRLFVAAAMGFIALTTTNARAATTRIRVAIPEFQLEGSPPPALGIQLQDGFVLGWVRAGAHVLDPTDTAKKLEAHPELQRCDASPCLKSIGQVLDVNYIVRVKVEVAGNSYKSVGRLFTTEGAAPAALPFANQSRACDVCTVNEAREHMIRLAEGVRARIEQYSAPPAPPSPAPQRSRTPGVLTVAVGLAAIFGGALLISSSPDTGKRGPAIGGAMMGLGFSSSLLGLFATFDESRGLTFLRGRPSSL